MNPGHSAPGETAPLGNSTLGQNALPLTQGQVTLYRTNTKISASNAHNPERSYGEPFLKRSWSGNGDGLAPVLAYKDSSKMLNVDTH